jgi:F-box-like
VRGETELHSIRGPLTTALAKSLTLFWPISPSMWRVVGRSTFTPSDLHNLTLVRCPITNTPIGIQASVPESTVRMRIAKILTTFSTLYTKLANDANEYIPLYRLPDDLLLAIWEYLSPQERLHIPAVSRRFRDVALASHGLWRFISIAPKYSTNKLEALLARTGTAGLHLYTHDRGKETPNFSFGSVTGPKPDQPSSAQSRVKMVDDALVRCTALAASINSHSNGSFQFGGKFASIRLETLELRAPRLRSLWLIDVGNSSSNVIYPIPLPLFGGYTPQLLHVHFTHFSPRWNDPIFNNLTYLWLDGLMSRFSVFQMLNILKKCPNLEHLLLHSVLSAQIGEDSLPSVALPSLRHLSIVEEASECIISLVDQLHTGPSLRFGFSSATFPAFTVRGTRQDAPWALISKADELIISGSGFEGSTFSVMSKQAGVILAHFCLSLTRSDQPPKPEHTALLVDSIRHSNFPFHSIKRLRFQGAFLGTGAIQELIILFPSLEVLETVDFSVKDAAMASGFNAWSLAEVQLDIKIVGKEMCPNLCELRTISSQYGKIDELIRWFDRRNDFGHRPLKHVTVYASQPLGLTNRKQMNRLVENIKWRKRPTRFIEGGSIIFGQPANEAATWDDSNPDEDPLVKESTRSESVPKNTAPYLGDHLPDYFGVPQ